jgi:hypothetical protein
MGFTSMIRLVCLRSLRFLLQALLPNVFSDVDLGWRVLLEVIARMGRSLGPYLIRLLGAVLVDSGVALKPVTIIDTPAVLGLIWVCFHGAVL